MSEYSEIKKICEMSAKEIRKERKWTSRGKWYLRQLAIYYSHRQLWNRAYDLAKIERAQCESHADFYKTICQHALQLSEYR